MSLHLETVRWSARNLLEKVLWYKEDVETKRLRKKHTYPPIYHIHIRKTAGTTINYAFLKALQNKMEPDNAYQLLSKKSNHRLITGHSVFVAHNLNLINQGLYSFAFSHIPYHKLNLPSNAFKITCFRDPVKRVISHYNMLCYFNEHSIAHPCMKTESAWLGDSFEAFLNRVPKEVLMNQLYMFSEKLDLHTALKNASNIDYIMFNESLKTSFFELGNFLGIGLESGASQKSFGHNESISELEIELLNDHLSEEISFWKKIKEERVCQLDRLIKYNPF